MAVTAYPLVSTAYTCILSIQHRPYIPEHGDLPTPGRGRWFVSKPANRRRAFLLAPQEESEDYTRQRRQHWLRNHPSLKLQGRPHSPPWPVQIQPLTPAASQAIRKPAFYYFYCTLIAPARFQHRDRQNLPVSQPARCETSALQPPLCNLPPPPICSSVKYPTSV